LVIVVVIVVVITSLIVTSLTVVASLVLRGGTRASLLKIVGHFDISVGQSIEK